MKKQFLYIFVLCLTTLISCENEIFFQQDHQEPQLLMNAFLEAGKKENKVYLRIAKDAEMVQVGNGSVKLFINGEEKETAEAKILWINSGLKDSLKACVLETPLNPGDHIRLEATAENGKFHASAETEMPYPVSQIEVDTCRTLFKIDYGMTECMQYKIKINDRPGEKNYYQLVIQEGIYFGEELPDDWEPTNYVEIINQEDVVLTDGHMTTSDDDEYNFMDMAIRNVNNVFTDRRFPDASYTLKVYTRYYEPDVYVMDYAIRILSISEPMYRYLRALNCLQSEDYDETFMEPVIIPDNVEGGLGFVGASADSKIIIRIIDKRH